MKDNTTESVALWIYEQQEWEVLEQFLTQLGADEENGFSTIMEAALWADEIL
ncbi:hypothetical protein IG605_008805 [Pectobacterium quasiaquaticum]|uniref:hypothetical protein n=1 Tax=Pectobacterium quasiaquaticum TaxID=2774015 RepID=UPI001CF7A75A|nr:hypothetical protein [Pectobacterium quasiaquaticum]URG54346.1 hypothetical protein IG605_008805 [Pectobacterium quasiaquaticum]